MTANSWVPPLPNGWQKTTLRRMGRIFAGGTPDRKNESYWSGGEIPWLNSGAVNQEIITQPTTFITEQAIMNGATRWVAPKSVLIALAGQGKTKGMSARTEIRSTFNQSLAAIEPHNSLDYRYLHYWVQSNYQNIRNLAGGDLRDGLNLEHIGSIELPLPPQATQHRIADYLDHETAEIDALMNDLETFDRLLVEHFSSFAERRIWQHKFPLCKAKYFCDTLSGFPFKSGEFQDPSPTNRRLLRGINVSPGTLTWADCVAIAEESAAGYREFEIAEGDLLLGLDRPLITDGLRVAPAKAEDAGSLLVQRVLRIRVDKAQTSTRWVQLTLQGSKFKDFLIPSFSGVSVPHMSPGQVENFKIPLPSMSEQEEVLKQVDAEENVMSQTRSDIRSAIALARERRAALITAAVTGQIDVTARNKPAAEQLEDDIAQGLHREN